MATKATQKNSNNLYLQIIKGRLASWHKEPIEGQTKEIVTDGVVKGHATYYESMEGKLARIMVYEKEFSKDKFTEMLSIILKGEKGYEVLETEFKGSHATDFLMRLPNIKLEEAVALKVFTIKDDEKSAAKGKEIFNRSIVAYQPEKVDRFFTKENPNSLPEAQVKELKNKKGKEYDFSEREDFFRGLVIEYNEKIQALISNKSEAVEETSEVTES